MKVFRTISAIVLAFLVLVSSTSFMVGFHFCMGHVQNVALFTKADGCVQEEKLPPCHRHQQAPCCADEILYHQGDDFKAATEHFHVVAPTPIYIEHPTVVIAEVVPASPLSRNLYYNYDPPWRSCDLTVVHQVFLI